MTYEVADLVVKRDEGVQITYADGATAEFNLVELRLGCPCAECRSLRDRGEDVWPRPSSPIPLRINDASLHGAWSLNVVWNDGHGSGLYPFDALRRWAEGNVAPGFEPGLLGEPPAPEPSPSETRSPETRSPGAPAASNSPARLPPDSDQPPDFI